ncbi:hypothetical protein LZC95_21230 [Pendulispora brunnea]|uniref:Bacterial surface antigen (D15) domain-containing protein n=1 Tax=Pendulispora brunnea TaxID=2905690 RepID=A0ABZ2KKZ4_9BACT
MKKMLGFVLALAASAAPRSAWADDESSVEVVSFPTVALVRALEVSGTTHKDTIASLLPRPLPATMRGDEMVEFERRINNLGIYDSVSVSYDAAKGTMNVAVRRKFTLTPSIEFSSGQSLADTYVMLGLTEYDFLGRALMAWGEASYEQRGPNFEIGFAEHVFAANSFMLGAEAYYQSAGFRFDSGDGWYRNRAGAVVRLHPPFTYGTPLRYELFLNYYRETSTEPDITYTPGDGHAVRSALEITWDRYTWRDLAPSGVELTVHGITGGFFPANQPRHSLKVNFIGAIAPTETTALMVRMRGEVFSKGNVNHSALLGSLEGVRGLDDAFFRNQVQAFVNVEARQAWRFARRWAVQGVLFTDAAVFRPFDAHAETMTAQSAWSAGGGLRLIPTSLTQLLLRFDAGTMIHPDRHFFVQFGFKQYFE